MNISKFWEELSAMENIPEPGTKEHQAWLTHEDTIAFLMNTSVFPFPLYISAGIFYIYSVIIPKANLSGNYVDDLMNWNFTVSQGWGYGLHFENGEPHKAIFPPLYDTGTDILNNCQPIIYYKQFEGFPRGEVTYLELDQKIEHILGLHWVPSMTAYCKLDHLGGIKPVIQNSFTSNGILSVTDLNDFEFYLYLTDSVIVRVFDIMRYKGLSWSDDKSSERMSHFKSRNSELHARLVTARDIQSYLRGFQIIHRLSSDDMMQRVLEGKEPTEKEYASFIAMDWKHKKVHECSCAPQSLASYYEESDLPFQVTPAFFRPDVLLKYKQSPEKYELDYREIICRGTWSLPYDINEDGQVHAYLYDLARLPYEEQLYWRSFNEQPKSGISKRAFRSDFQGMWDDEYDPLLSLRIISKDYPYAIQFGIKQPIWRIPNSTNPISRVSHVVTDSPKEWEDQILELSRVIIDNLDKGSLRKVAKSLNCDDPQLGSLKLLRSCLENQSVDPDVTEEIMQPLEELWLLRSKGIAHFGDSVPKTDLKIHFSTLLAQVDKAMRNLAELINKGLFNIAK